MTLIKVEREKWITLFVGMCKAQRVFIRFSVFYEETSIE